MKSYEQFLDNSSSAIILVDTSDKVLLCNKSAEDLLKINSEKLVGKSFLETIYKIPKGGVTIESIIPLTDGVDRIANRLIFFKKGDSNLEAQALVFHQLNAPLAAIKWTVESLLDMPVLKGEVKDKLIAIDNSSMALIELVGDLLTLGRITTERLSISLGPTNIQEIINKIIVVLKPIADFNSQTIVFKMGEGEKIIRADPNLLSRVLNNIIENAINYSPKGSKISVSCDCAVDGVVITINNSGSEIAPEEQSLIFTKFFRTQAAKNMKPSGSGLGLFISKSIVEAHGGKIWFESNKEKGTTFFIKLPRT